MKRRFYRPLKISSDFNTHRPHSREIKKSLHRTRNNSQKISGERHKRTLNATTNYLFFLGQFLSHVWEWYKIYVFFFSLLSRNKGEQQVTQYMNEMFFFICESSTHT